MQEERERPQDERGLGSKVETQHRLIDSLIGNVASALDSGDCAQAEDRALRLLRAIDAHFSLEEQHYFPRAEAERADLAGVLHELVDEHHTLNDELAAALRALEEGALEDARRAFVRFRDVFVSHERREVELLTP